MRIYSPDGDLESTANPPVDYCSIQFASDDEIVGVRVAGDSWNQGTGAVRGNFFATSYSLSGSQLWSFEIGHEEESMAPNAVAVPSNGVAVVAGAAAQAGNAQWSVGFTQAIVEGSLGWDDGVPAALPYEPPFGAYSCGPAATDGLGATLVGCADGDTFSILRYTAGGVLSSSVDTELGFGSVNYWSEPYVVAGGPEGEIFAAFQDDFVLFSVSGNEILRDVFDGPQDVEISDAVIDSQGNIVLAAVHRAEKNGKMFDVSLAKISAGGESIWQHYEETSVPVGVGSSSVASRTTSVDVMSDDSIVMFTGYMNDEGDMDLRVVRIAP
jgi:hypothetical protein